jgi:hypothetical protein
MGVCSPIRHEIAAGRCGFDAWIVQRLPALDGVPVWDSMAFENETVFLGMEDRR